VLLLAFRLTQSAKKGPGATWKAYTKRVKMIKKKQFCRWSQEKKNGPLISTNTIFEKTLATRGAIHFTASRLGLS
jgi:hypothetical protein